MSRISDVPAGLPTLAFVWDQFAPYHSDRCEAVANRLGDRYRVQGIEIASRSETYAWAPSEGGEAYERVTLSPNALQDTTWQRRLSLLIAQLRRRDVRSVFLCNYERPEIFIAAVWARLTGRRIFIMNDSKFDDRPRQLWREWIKVLMYLPYHGALASGARTRDYLCLLGFREKRIALGYDTLSVERIRRLAAADPAPAGARFAERHFTVIGRFVPKKNISLAIAAYDIYCQGAGSMARQLVIVGAGPLESALRADVARRGLDGVVFTGFLQEDGVARALASSLALILPSIEEQWGLVVNEALAMSLPILCSENVGARDDLVRVGINGYVVEPDNAVGLARFMGRLSGDEAEWRRLCEGSHSLAPQADVARFADAVVRMLDRSTDASS